MKKLIKLKEWLTVPETAKYLTVECGEVVTEADVFRLGLDGRLRLSVNFVNHAEVRSGKTIDWIETNWKIISGWGDTQSPLSEFIFRSSSDRLTTNGEKHALIDGRRVPPKLQALLDKLPAEELNRVLPLLLDISIDNDRFIFLDETVTTISGIWDLPLIGNEQLDIERKYQQLTEGPEVTLVGIDGAFVQGPDGKICQLQERYEDNEYVTAEKRDELRKKGMLLPNNEKYYPAGGLPDDAVIVVRTDSLREFEVLFDSCENVDTILARVEANKSRRGVFLDLLKLHSWPLNGKYRDVSLVNALRRSKWVERAVVCKDPLTVNPALLAYALQDKAKPKQTGFFIPAKQLGNYLAENFPDFFDEYQELIDFEKSL